MLMKIPKVYLFTLIITLPVMIMMCTKPSEFPEAQFDPRLSGGEATVFDATSKALGHEVPGMNERDTRVHEIGDNASDQTFVTAPAPLNSGLGPIFNNVSCKNCHHNDGKGDPTTGLVTSSMLIRLSMPGTDANGGDLPVPGYGLQLQDEAVFNVQPEAKVNISYEEQIFTYPDGAVCSLRKPTYTLQNLYAAMPAGYMLSPRLAPPFFGLGLIQNIPESTILSFADENGTPMATASAAVQIMYMMNLPANDYSGGLASRQIQLPLQPRLLQRISRTWVLPAACAR